MDPARVKSYRFLQMECCINLLKHSDQNWKIILARSQIKAILQHCVVKMLYMKDFLNGCNINLANSSQFS